MSGEATDVAGNKMLVIDPTGSLLVEHVTGPAITLSATTLGSASTLRAALKRFRIVVAELVTSPRSRSAAV